MLALSENAGTGAPLAVFDAGLWMRGLPIITMTARFSSSGPSM